MTEMQMGVIGPMGLMETLPWEDVPFDTLRGQTDAELVEMWADVEHEAWLASLFADQPSAATPASDPLFTEWWDDGAKSVAGQRTLLGRSDVDVLPDYQRDDWVGI